MKKFMLVLLIAGGVEASLYDAGMWHLFFYPGARATAMAGAFTAYAGDATAPFYNPASISFIERRQFTAQNLRTSLFTEQLFERLGAYYFGVSPDSVPGRPPWLGWEGMYHTFLGAVFPFRKGFSLAVWGSGFYEGTMEFEGKVWHPHDYNISLTVSYRPFWRREFPAGMDFAVGATFKYLHSYVCPDDILKEFLGVDTPGGSAWSPAFDLGFLIKGPADLVRGGLSLHNLFGRLKYLKGEGDTTVSIPRYVRYGLGARPLKLVDIRLPGGGLLTDFVDITVNYDRMRDLLESPHDIRESAGLELSLMRTFYLRWGRYRENGKTGSTRGMGLRIGPLSYDISDQAQIYYNTEHSYVVTVSLVDPGKASSTRGWEKYLVNVLIPGTGNILEGDYLVGSALAIGGSLFYQGITEGKKLKLVNYAGLGVTYLLSYAILLKVIEIPRFRRD